jgi:hypothetical protein
MRMSQDATLLIATDRQRTAEQELGDPHGLRRGTRMHAHERRTRLAVGFVAMIPVAQSCTAAPGLSTAVMHEVYLGEAQGQTLCFIRSQGTRQEHYDMILHVGR